MPDASKMLSQYQDDHHKLSAKATFASRFIIIMPPWHGSLMTSGIDLTDDQLCERLGHVGRKKELDLIAVYSGKDEYVPSFVDKEVLLRRLVKAMNNGVEDGNGVKMEGGNQGNNARGLMLEDANHNLSKSEGDGARFVGAVGRLLSRW